MDQPDKAPAPYRGLTGRALARAIFQADVPQEYIKSIPAQSLYLAVKQNGLHSSADIIELASLNQCRVMTDLDFWQHDRFNENNFWEWLALPDDEGGLQVLQKFLKFIDLKLVALIISKYLSVKVFDEPTENPPGEKWHTPDQGFTWLHLNIEDEARHFLFSRFLAVIFETSAEVFYQLIGSQNVATESMLEEESFQERSKRLSGEGIPDFEYACEVNAPLSEAAVQADLSSRMRHSPVKDIPSIEPMLYQSRHVEPLNSLLSRPGLRETLEGELSLIMNAAIVRWAVEFYEHEEVLKLADKVKGAVNVGLQISQKLSSLGLEEIYEVLGLIKIYRLGLSRILPLRKKAEQLSRKVNITDTALLSLISSLSQPFPAIPEFTEAQSTASPVVERKPALEQSTLDKPIFYLEEIEQVESTLQG